MDLQYSFHSPTKIIFGKDNITCLGKLLRESSLNKVLIVSGRNFIYSSGINDKLTAILKEENITFYFFSNVPPEPTSDIVDLLAQELTKYNVEAIIAIGGGSVIDVAKLAAIQHSNGGKSTDYEKGKKILKKPLPLIAIPTTAGSGSEVTPYSVINNKDTGRKFTIKNDFIYPECAIIDPALTVTLPPLQTLSTALDSFIHALESALSKRSNNPVQLLSKYTIKQIFENLPKALETPDSIIYRTALAESAYLGGIAISNVRTGLIHTFSVAFGVFTDLPHGYLNAVIMPYILKFNIDSYGGALHELLSFVDGYTGKRDEDAFMYLINWLRDLGVKKNVKFEFDDEFITKIVQRVLQDKELSSVNIKPFNSDDLKNIAKEIIGIHERIMQ